MIGYIGAYVKILGRREEVVGEYAIQLDLSFCQEMSIPSLCRPDPVYFPYSLIRKKGMNQTKSSIMNNRPGAHESFVIP